MDLTLRTITTAFQQSKVSVTKNPDDIKNVLFDFFFHSDDEWLLLQRHSG